MGNKHDQRPAAAIAGISAQLEGFDRLFRHGLRGKRWLEGGERSAALLLILMRRHFQRIRCPLLHSTNTKFQKKKDGQLYSYARARTQGWSNYPLTLGSFVALLFSTSTDPMQCNAKHKDQQVIVTRQRILSRMSLMGAG